MYLLFLEKIFSLAKLLIKSTASISTLLSLLLNYIPALLVIAIPLALLISTIALWGKLIHDNEIIAIVSSGIKLTVLERPLIILGIIFSAVVFIIGETILPHTNLSIKYLINTLTKSKTAVLFFPQTFTKINDMEIYVDKVKDNTVLMNLYIYQKDKNISILSKKGYIVDNKLFLFDGIIYRTKEGFYSILKFKTYQLLFGVEEAVVERGLRELNCLQLIRELRSSEGLYRRMVSFEIHKRIALACACVVVVFFGLSISRYIRSGRGVVAVGWGGMVFIAYYILFNTMQVVSIEGIFPAALSANLPNILLLLLSLILRHKKPV